MVPVATPPNCPETVAVRVTNSSKPEGFGDEVNVVEEVALLTVWLTVFDVLPEKFKSPG
jgi:hypothetical protein